MSASLDVLGRNACEDLFAPSPPERRRVGAEVEVIPTLADGTVCPVRDVAGAGVSSLGFLRPYATANGWHERSGLSPTFHLPGGHVMSFEPGGQWELSTFPAERGGDLLGSLRSTMDPLVTAARDAGLELLSIGIDPRNRTADVPLQLFYDRYTSMTTYFDHIGPYGARMMRQTAATQLSVDTGARPDARWQLLSDLAPYLTAIFANSARYGGYETGCQSYRALCWRRLDLSRTGLPANDGSARPWESYLDFALAAADIRRRDERGDYRSFGDWMRYGEWDAAAWEMHLTTLFPEVRPRGRFEIRSIDAVPPEWYAAPVVLVTTLVYDERATRAARELVPRASAVDLERAARCGLRDGGLAAVSRDLFRLALDVARERMTIELGGQHVEIAEEFFNRYTSRGRSLADDVPHLSPA